MPPAVSYRAAQFRQQLIGAYVLQDLEDYCLQYCLNHTSDVIQTDNFQALTLDVMRRFITEAAKRGAFKR